MSHDQATGSVVVVTGALSGIGEATALAFAQCGDDAGERLARYLAAVGAPTHCLSVPMSGSSARSPT
jgi:NAD(P)-dependent dehydrogenase (short-subunit alcohol dehydrogenase family)